MIKVGTPKLKQFDTSPNVGVQLAIGGVPYSLIGTTTVARLKFSFALKETLALGSKILKTSIETKLRLNDILRIDQEQLQVILIDDVSDPGFYRLKVKRAQNSTTESAHSVGTDIDVILVERNAKIASGNNNSIAFFEWVANDTARTGQFELEFEVTESQGAKFSVPETPIAITISQDFNRR